VRVFVRRLADFLEQELTCAGLFPTDVSWVGDEDAPRSVTFTVPVGREHVPIASGTYALVDREIRGAGARSRWFASVSLFASEDGRGRDIAAVNRADVDVTACRAGGPGGQNVNKVSSAIRAVHRPSGVAVRVVTERSQKANLDHALRRIAELLAEREGASRKDALTQRRKAHYALERGNPVRTFERSARTGLREVIL
jgi:peptide chain release factor 2/peptide chain release factor